MPRQPRAAPGGFVYHTLNRAVARTRLLRKDGDFEAFERVIVEAMAKHSVNRGQPYGAENWQAKIAKELNLEHTFRKPGRPKKKAVGSE